MAGLVTSSKNSSTRLQTKISRRRFSITIVTTVIWLGAAIKIQAAITATTYPFSNSSGVALEDMSTGTTQIVPANSANYASLAADIGFDFWYDGVRFTRFSVNSDGLCRLGNSPISGGSNSLGTSLDAPKIAPYWDALIVGTNGKAHFKVVGSAPNRKLVVEWLNEQIPRNAINVTGAGTFQMWLFESTGVIEFVYGSGVVANSAQGGYSVGLQSGASTNFASVTTSGPTVSYVSANNTQSTAIASGTAYSFTPNVPLAPTGLSFTNTSAVSTTLNWTDNASNEIGYAIYQSTDNVNFSFVTQTGANATSQVMSGLNPGTTYFFKVFAATEGALSSALAGSEPTGNTGSIVSVAAAGNWSSTATWVGGVVPTASDNVTIANGATVTIDTTANAYSLTVGTGSAATLQFDAGTARTLTVETSVLVSANAVFQSATSGTVTNHILSVGTDLTNNGVLDFSTNSNTAGADITFTSPNNGTFSGTGATTDIRTITVNKGTSGIPVIELMPGNFTVRGVTTNVAGFLTLTNGTLKISGTYTIANRVFTTGSYTIPATAGFWLNNPNFTVSGQNGSPTVDGSLRVSSGGLNIGTSSGNSMGFPGGSTITIEGGVVSVTGRFGSTGTTPFTYNQSGGTITVCTSGNASSALASFDLGSAPASVINISGGTIIIQLAGTGSSGPKDYRNNAGSPSGITGGTLQLGNSSSGAAKTFLLTGAVPNLVVTNTSAGHTASFQAPANFSNQSLGLTINGTATLNIGSSIFLCRGTTITNDGVITDGGAGARFDFAGSGPMTYTGSGTFGTNATPVNGISSNSSSLVTLNAPIVANQVNLFQGGFVNSNQLTLGNGGTSTVTIQIGSAGQATPGGNFDVSPNWQQGTGGEIVIYAQESTPRTTGLEINPTRTATSMSVDNTNNLTIAGGDLTLSGTGNMLTLTNGVVFTGSNTLFLSSGAGFAARTNGYVDGNLKINFSSASSQSLFPVGTSTGYSPVILEFSSSPSYPAAATITAHSGQQPNYGGTLTSLKRYWTIAGPASFNATFSFNYLAADVVGNEANYRVARYNGGWTVAGFDPPNTGNHSALGGGFVPGDWTLMELDSDFDIMPDAYEDANGLNKNNAADANTDLDKDGQTNLAEYLAGTDPQSATSVLRITSTARSSGQYLINFNAVANKTYRLQSKDNINDVSWQNVGIADLIPSVSGTTQFIDTTLTTQTKRFYHVQLITP